MSELEKRFIKRFGKKNAELIIKAGTGHVDEGNFYRENGWDYGDDKFGNCLLLVISFQCIEKYANFHGFDISYIDFIDFCNNNKALIKEITGDIDYLGAFAGVYDDLMEENENENGN